MVWIYNGPALDTSEWHSEQVNVKEKDHKKVKMEDGQGELQQLERVTV